MANQHTFGMIDKGDESRIREVTSQYMDLLDDTARRKIYFHKIDDLIRHNGSRIIFNINDIRRQMPERATGLIKNFVDEIICLERALKETIVRTDLDFASDKEFHAGFEGSFGDRHVTPRSLKSFYLGNMVCCEGIVVRCSLVRPKIVKSFHYCPATKKTLEKKYTDYTSYDSFQTTNTYPKEDENKNPLETEFGKCVYKDHQVFSIQELPENAPAGHLPRTVDVIADDDLADCCKPGDRVRVIGLFRVLPNKQGGFTTGNFRSIIIANNIQLISKELTLFFEGADIRNIRQMSRHKDIFELIARSLAPSIYGLKEVKKAILCLLLGGTERLLDNGTRLRGDINVLLIGDPSVAKSQLLRYVLHAAPRVVSTTGRGSSGVGLTAAVVHDSDSNERHLEAGAMVLADRGIVCIDEFDKMADIDRTAIHEVMEQGRVTISKAGIHARLNARCSVLAAANPVFGNYNVLKSAMENIGMQDSLLSRFDLIFVLTDKHEINRDRIVAHNVVKLHQYRTPGEEAGTVLPMSVPGAGSGGIGSALDPKTVGSKTLHGSRPKDIYENNRDWTAVEEGKKILNAEFLRKYIHMAMRIRPQLTDEAATYISERYAELRSMDGARVDCERTMPITARQLETLIRLSTAIAKARFSKKIELIDARKAYDLLYFSCFKEKPLERIEFEEKRKHKKQSSTGEITDGKEAATDETTTDKKKDNEEEIGETQDSAIDSNKSTLETEHDVPESSAYSEEAAFEAENADPTPVISVERYKRFKVFLRKAFDEASDETVPLGDIQNRIQAQAQATSQPYTEAELQAAFDQLSEENIVFIHDEMITLI